MLLMLLQVKQVLMMMQNAMPPMASARPIWGAAAPTSGELLVSVTQFRPARLYPLGNSLLLLLRLILKRLMLTEMLTIAFALVRILPGRRR